MSNPNGALLDRAPHNNVDKFRAAIEYTGASRASERRDRRPAATRGRRAPWPYARLGGQDRGPPWHLCAHLTRACAHGDHATGARLARPGRRRLSAPRRGSQGRRLRRPQRDAAR